MISIFIFFLLTRNIYANEIKNNYICKWENENNIPCVEIKAHYLIPQLFLNQE